MSLHQNMLTDLIKNNFAFTAWMPVSDWTFSDQIDLTKSLPPGTEVIQRQVTRNPVESGYTPTMWLSGFATTQTEDRHKETVFQEGLDFTDCLDNGWFNDDHKQGTTDNLGRPMEVALVRHPKYNLAWATKGFLFDWHQRAREIYKYGQNLRGTGRRLGFSIEGKVGQRAPNAIIKASVRNIAITGQPANVTATWDVVQKCLTNHTDFQKALEASVGVAPSAGGQIFVPGDVEGQERRTKRNKDGVIEPGTLMTPDTAYKYLKQTHPQWPEHFIHGVILAAAQRAENGESHVPRD